MGFLRTDPIFLNRAYIFWNNIQNLQCQAEFKIVEITLNSNTTTSCCNHLSLFFSWNVFGTNTVSNIPYQSAFSWKNLTENWKIYKMQNWCSSCIEYFIQWNLHFTALVRVKPRLYLFRDFSVFFIHAQHRSHLPLLKTGSHKRKSSWLTHIAAIPLVAH